MLQELNKTQTSFADDYLTLFDVQHQADVKAGISRARDVNDKPPALYANTLYNSFDDIKHYLDARYTNKAGNKLGSNGRRELIAAFLTGNKESFSRITG